MIISKQKQKIGDVWEYNFISKIDTAWYLGSKHDALICKSKYQKIGKNILENHAT